MAKKQILEWEMWCNIDKQYMIYYPLWNRVQKKLIICWGHNKLSFYKKNKINDVPTAIYYRFSNSTEIGWVLHRLSLEKGNIHFQWFLCINRSMQKTPKLLKIIIKFNLHRRNKIFPSYIRAWIDILASFLTVYLRFVYIYFLPLKVLDTTCLLRYSAVPHLPIIPFSDGSFCYR